MEKQFKNMKDLGKYVFANNLRVEKRVGNIVYLHNNTSQQFKRTVIVNF